MFNLFFKVYKFLNSKEKNYFNLIILLTIFVSILETLSVATLLPLIKIILGDTDFLNFFILKDLKQNFDLNKENLIILIILAIIILFIIKGIIIFFIELFKENFLKNINNKFSSIVYSNYINTDYEKVLDFKLSDKIRNVGLVAALTTFMKSSYIIMGDLILFFCLIVFLMNINFYITIVLILFVSIFGLLMILFSKNRLIFYSKINTEHTSKYFQNLISVLNSLKEVIILDRKNQFKDQFNKTIRTIAKAQKKNNLLRFIPRIIYEIGAITIISVVVIYYVIQGIETNKSLETLAIFVAVMVKIIPGFNKIVMNYQNLNVAFYPSSKILEEFEFLYKKNNSTKIQQNFKKMKFEKKIEIKNLSFSYHGSSEMIFENFNLEIKKGEIIGFFGPSGGGKSTLMNLVLGFLKPTSGKISIDSQDISNDLNSWHNCISYIPQDIYLLNDTIKNNILFGLDEFDLKKETLEKALDLSNLNEFLEKLPNGLETIVGEKAIKLSGGQGQRICIARSLLKDYDIIILDEATSKLDKKNENEILKKITSKHLKEKTIIIISHRYDTLRKYCDKIYNVTKKLVNLDYEK